MSFWRDHFDHILLVLLGIIGGIGGIICAAHHMDKPSEWCFVEAAASLSALLMRMNGPRVTQLPNGQNQNQS